MHKSTGGTSPQIFGGQARHKGCWPIRRIREECWKPRLSLVGFLLARESSARGRSVGNCDVSEVDRRSETRSLYVCALCMSALFVCLAALLESLFDRREAHDRLVFKSDVLYRQIEG
jgi:hypothetical protein